MHCVLIDHVENDPNNQVVDSELDLHHKITQQLSSRRVTICPTRNPIIIDVEASGFGGMSYPIEVGVALDDDTKYCSLIFPAPEWQHWDEDAEKVHRIARDILETYGNPIQDFVHRWMGRR